MRKIILICGKAGAGKNTVGDVISRITHGTQYAFADCVKDIAREMGWDDEKDEKGRRLLQEIGTAGRNYYKDVWVDKVISKIHFQSSFISPVTIITDWRYINEVEKIKKAFPDVITIRVIGREYDLGVNADHESEHGLDGVMTDYVLSNDEPLSLLEESVRYILRNEGMI